MPDDENAQIRPIDRGWMAALAVVIVVGILTVLLFALSTSNPSVVTGVSYLLAGACLLVGGLVGFLFGIPRSDARDDEEPTNNQASPDSTEGDSRRGTRYRPNTNLEQISDWLTKILVGVGLTQLRDLPSAINSAATYMGEVIGAAGGKGLAVGILVYFPAAGFLFGFLWTRLFLGAALARADVEAALAAVARRQDQQQQYDAAALALVQQYLTPQSQARISTKAVSDAIIRASAPIKVQIFYQAQKVRRENWESNKAVMERAIPIFETLIACDVEQQFHQNFAQLGYALKDKRSPDLTKAIEMLTKAIEIRGDWRHSGWVIYEANRAECAIKSDKNYNQKRLSEPSSRASIVADMRIALKAPDLRPWLDSLPFSDWKSLNQVSVGDLADNEGP